MNTLTSFKRGDTFSLACTWKQGGVATSITGLTIAAQIRNTYGMTLVDTLTVVPGNQSTTPGSFTLVPSVADTNSWPLGSLICDLQVTNGSNIRSSDSFLIPVIEDVTK
ncbi:hypothetical protein UFOVP14_29 [uncultured Caudovirales phage]|uniref:BppU N-terminal domain-containing protein n=1 Tax=uncultured Caudovirales phage TaxID=2100421 RepID=A0A6J5KJ00_9CAUD|nr:hypothetical protein UFOVP14_29 [uncultured Caudovirales phage]